MHPVCDLRQFLTGPWAISRRILDLRLGIAGRLVGEGVFSARADGLRYVESGRLQFGAYRGPASRTYLVAFPDQAMALFREEDGRDLYRLDLSNGFSAILHHCGSDCYRGRCRVLDEGRLSIGWRVEGPRKNYRMLSFHTRLAGR